METEVLPEKWIVLGEQGEVEGTIKARQEKER